MHNYQEDVFSRAFDEIAANDIQWGAESVDWLGRGTLNEHKQAYVGLYINEHCRLEAGKAHVFI